MRITLIVIALTIISAAYYFSQNDAPPQQTEATKSPVNTTPLLGMTNMQMHGERQPKPANVEQQQLTLMNDRLATLEARFRDIEATTSAHTQDPIAAIPSSPEPRKAGEKTKPKKLSEADLGQWMDKTLDAGDFDRHTTKSITEQMVTSLAEVPGINLADMQCGERFCRASFVSDNGKAPNVVPLIGASPFIESGFTVTEPDGRVKVYFTQPGQSLSDLRDEAQESALQNTPLS